MISKLETPTVKFNFAMIQALLERQAVLHIHILLRVVALIRIDFLVLHCRSSVSICLVAVLSSSQSPCFLVTFPEFPVLIADRILNADWVRGYCIQV